MGAIFGPLAAILIGAEAGAGDVAVGVFRDLVATGRSRLALFATRVPAAIALSWIVTSAAYALLVIGVYALAAGSATPSASEMLDGVGFSLLSTGVICAIAVGLGAVSPSRPATLTALIGWQLIASPILANISSLGNFSSCRLMPFCVRSVVGYERVADVQASCGEKRRRRSSDPTWAVGCSAVVWLQWATRPIALISRSMGLPTRLM